MRKVAETQLSFSLGVVFFSVLFFRTMFLVFNTLVSPNLSNMFFVCV